MAPRFASGPAGTPDAASICTPCFTPGTQIATPFGQSPVERLSVGDKVLTRDNGAQRIAWIGKRTLAVADLKEAPELRPVTIKAGALGHGLPFRDMTLSPNHRVLIAEDGAPDSDDVTETLVSARHLVDGRGIRQSRAETVTYVHFLLDAHEVVLSDGSWTESFEPSKPWLDGIGAARRAEILALFPELVTEEGAEAFAAARRVIDRDEALSIFPLSRRPA